MSRGIGRPFSRGEFTYATNGHICIRVPRLPDVGDDERAPNPETLFNEAVARSDTLWSPLPPFELKTEPCDHCKGGGKVKLCPWCKGFGTCKRCDQAWGFIPAKATDEKAEDCEECEGAGRTEDPGNIIVSGVVEEARLSAAYLARIADLPGVEIAVHDHKAPVRIRFDGGEGLLMPMRIRMCRVTMTCGGCGHQDDLDEFCRTPISGELPKGRYQCPACGLAIWKVLSPLTGKVCLIEVEGVL